jgi:hypothetical protein
MTTGRFTKRARRFCIAALLISVAALSAAAANAAIVGISGATAWGPCNWYTSENVR